MAISSYDAGSWQYRLDRKAWDSVGSPDPAYLERFLKKIQQCAVILGKGELFIASQVTLSRWIQLDLTGEDMTELDIEPDTMEIDYAPDIRLDQLIFERVMARQCPGGAVRAEEIAIRGWTSVQKPGADLERVPDLVCVDAAFMGGGVIDIRVFGDLWLPFSLDGTTANAAYPKYADILETALNDVEHTLGVEPIFDRFGDICMVNRYRLENYTDSDDEIIGVDWSGRVL